MKVSKLTFALIALTSPAFQQRQGVLAKRTSDGGGFNAADPVEDKLLRRVARKTTTGMPEEPSNSSVKAGGSLVGDDISSEVVTPSRNHAFGNASVQDRGPSDNGGGTGTMHNRASSIRGTLKQLTVVNVALDKPTSQSTTNHGGISSRAVDGNRNGSWGQNSVTHSDKQSNPWWSVDLQNSYEISSINVYNRADCCSNRLANFQLKIFRTGDVVWTYSHSGAASYLTAVNVPSDVFGDKLEVSLLGGGKILSLAEVEVYIHQENSYDNVSEDLRAIHDSFRVCETGGDELLDLVQEAKGNLEKTQSLSQKIVNFEKKIRRVVKSAKLLLMVAKFVPKLGKVLKFIVEKIVRVHRVLLSVKKVLPSADNCAKIINKLENVEKALEYFISLSEDGANEAEESIETLELAVACSSVDAVEHFTRQVEDPVKSVAEAASVCDLVDEFMRELKLDFISLLAEVLDQIMEVIDPILKVIDDVLDIVAGEVTEAVCCTMPVHLQSFATLIGEVVDLATCFAGPLEGLLDDILRELIPDISFSIGAILKFPRYEIAFESFRFEEEQCEFKLPSISVDLVGMIELDLEFDFDLHEAFGLVDDGVSFVDDLKQSCNPEGLDPDNWWGGDCCCTARGIMSKQGTACLRFEAFLSPGSYELASVLTGLDRCTCCENGDYISYSDDTACKGATGFCGKELPTPKKEWDVCSSTVDCECEGSLHCGQYSEFDKTYVCCQDTYNPISVEDLGDLDMFKDFCKATLNNGDLCKSNAGCKSGACGRVSREDDTYKCCVNGVGTWNGADYCRKTVEIGEPCHFDDQCKSGQCTVFEGMNVSICTGGNNEKCSCDYDNGGCHITEPAPKGKACLCRNTSAYTCYGYVVPCLSGKENSNKCKNPDKSRESCEMGSVGKYPNDSFHANCNGYRKGSDHEWYGPGSIGNGDRCFGFDDDFCSGSRSCAKTDAGNDIHICCDSTDWYGVDYCKNRSVGTKCHSDAMCQNGCGRAWYGTDTKKCCKSGVTRYAWNSKDYCRNMPDGYNCRTDAMCNSGLCLNNKCTSKKSEGEKCNSQKNAECWDGSCYRSTRYGNYKCCKDTNYCDTWNSGCTTGYWYCAKYGDKLG